MKGYVRADITRALEAVQIVPGDAVLVHSALFSLGRIRGIPTSEVPNAIRDTRLDYLGAEGTLVVPAFTFAFCNGVAFDRVHSPSVGMGQLSEAVRTHPRALRSKHPLQSVAVIGPLAASLCDPDVSASYADGGAFDRIVKNDFRLILLGTTVQAASLVHYAEERVGVPYRYYKTFTGPYVQDGHSTERTYQMYVRDLAIDPTLNLSPIEAALRERGEWRESSVGGGRIASCRTRAFVDEAFRLLNDDPWCLVGSRKDVHQ